MATTLALGDLQISRIVEQEGPFFDALQFLPGLTPELLAENRGWMAEAGALDPEGRLILCIQSYIVRTPYHTVLIDSCVGNDKQRPTRPFWHMRTDEKYMRGLASAGLAPDDIDFVLCTHLHADHVGWNTRLVDGRWVPTFPKARYVFSQRELDHWSERHAQEPLPQMADSVLPIVEANRAELVRSDHTLDDHVRLEPTPGHTPDHFAVTIGKTGREAIVTGDLIHTPLQARYPEMSMFVDYDRKQSAATRRAFLEGVCDSGTLICTAHFPSPSTGYVARWGEGFRLSGAR
jgi:glyoxylase-like metal-dependent hydrolase (beta-lactamase superfamily II)